jgi:hypothetical protein
MALMLVTVPTASHVQGQTDGGTKREVDFARLEREGAGGDRDLGLAVQQIDQRIERSRFKMLLTMFRK